MHCINNLKYDYFADSTCVEIWKMNFPNKFENVTIERKKKGAWLDYVNSKLKTPVKDENGAGNFKNIW